ncbi:MAG: hypothetical protein WCX85_03690 [Bacilli bacterium]|jgi:hypothetical protein|nr:hypothetical protein [Bacilli bacterium]
MKKLIPFVNILVLALLGIIWPLGAAVALYVPNYTGTGIASNIGNFYQVVWGHGSNLPSVVVIVAFMLLAVGSLLVIPAFIPFKLQRVLLAVIAVFFVAAGIIFLLMPTLVGQVNPNYPESVKLGGSVIGMSVLLLVGGVLEGLMAFAPSK